MRMFCSICKEIFIPYSEVKVTSCGHLYHGSCISRWNKQHKTCPQCRSNLTAQPFRVYFDVEKDNEKDPSTLEHQVETLSDKVRECETLIKSLKEERDGCHTLLEDMKLWGCSLKEKNHLLKTAQKALKDQVSHLSKQVKEVVRLEGEVESWKKKVISYERLELVLKGSTDEVNRMLESVTLSELSVRQLCTYVGVLKTQIHKCETKNIQLARENRELLKNIARGKQKNLGESEEIIKNLQIANTSLEKELITVKKILKESLRKVTEKMGSSSTLNTTEILDKKADLTMDLDLIEAKENETVKPQKDEALNNKWENLVCAGPSKYYGRPLLRTKSLGVSHFKDAINKEPLGIELGYAFDGLGGRKKIRLGGATPHDEFQKIKKSKNPAVVFKHKKIIEYYQVE